MSVGFSLEERSSYPAALEGFESAITLDSLLAYQHQIVNHLSLSDHTLTIEFREFTKIASPYFLEAIIHLNLYISSSIQELKFINCNLANLRENLERIVKAFSNLTSLSFQNCSLNNLNIYGLSEFLKKSINHLSISHQTFDEESWRYLIEGLDHSVVSSLSLNNNKISDDQLADLTCGALYGMSSLLSLNLSHNEISDCGIIDLSIWIKSRNISLAHLVLSGNVNIGEPGIALLSQAGESISHLHLSENQVFSLFIFPNSFLPIEGEALNRKRKNPDSPAEANSLTSTDIFLKQTADERLKFAVVSEKISAEVMDDLINEVSTLNNSLLGVSETTAYIQFDTPVSNVRLDFIKTALSIILATSQNIHEIKIVNCSLSSSAWQEFLNSLPSFFSLNSLVFENCALDTQQLQELLQPNNRFLKKLTICKQQVHEELLSCLVLGLKNLNINQLVLNDNNISNEQIKVLTKYKLNLPRLSLCRNAITDRGMIDLVQLIIENEEIAHIELDGNEKIGAFSVKLLKYMIQFRILQDPNTLNRLYYLSLKDTQVTRDVINKYLKMFQETGLCNVNIECGSSKSRTISSTLKLDLRFEGSLCGVMTNSIMRQLILFEEMKKIEEEIGKTETLSKDIIDRIKMLEDSENKQGLFRRILSKHFRIAERGTLLQSIIIGLRKMDYFEYKNIMLNYINDHKKDLNDVIKNFKYLKKNKARLLDTIIKHYNQIESNSDLSEEIIFSTLVDIFKTMNVTFEIFDSSASLDIQDNQMKSMSVIGESSGKRLYLLRENQFYRCLTQFA